MNGQTEPRASRIPPDGEELEFIRNRDTGTVHILPWDDSDPEYVPAGSGWGEHMAAMVAGPPPRMLCGVRLRLLPGATGEVVSVFKDEDLCVACVRALGDQSVRAFEHPQPGDAT